MEQSLPESELVVATPERVSFDYQVAGLGTRAIAQLLDLLILSAILVALFFAGLFVGIVLDSGVVANLMWILGSFVVIFGYFWVSEAMWSGQTIGKKAFRLRAVGDRGEPLTLIQAGIRNVVRVVDFLPYGYGVGLIVLFINGKGKRLGDLAAGTVVVKDSDHVWLWQLPGARPVDFQMASGQQAQMPLPPGYPPPPPPLIPPPPPEPPAPGPSPYTLASNAESILRRLDPELRRFVSSYAHRRPALGLELRVQLAGGIQPGLRRAMPDMFEQQGPLATLDYLADLERGLAT
ncbi:MAG: RDD family protein [Chloroflexi bacterium]|nr:MAG: RDD family protein [Chloroflexota bacterium]TME94014.1 MAG: RDD family protein [Chloroflexota bacterium]